MPKEYFKKNKKKSSSFASMFAGKSPFNYYSGTIEGKSDASVESRNKTENDWKEIREKVKKIGAKFLG